MLPNGYRYTKVNNTIRYVTWIPSKGILALLLNRRDLPASMNIVRGKMTAAVLKFNQTRNYIRKYSIIMTIKPCRSLIW